MYVPILRILVLPRERVLLTTVRAVPAVRSITPVQNRLTRERVKLLKEGLIEVIHQPEDRNHVLRITAATVLRLPEAVILPVVAVHARHREALHVQEVAEAGMVVEDNEIANNEKYKI